MWLDSGVEEFDFGVGKLYLAHYLSHGIIIVEGDAIAFFLI